VGPFLRRGRPRSGVFSLVFGLAGLAVASVDPDEVESSLVLLGLPFANFLRISFDNFLVRPCPGGVWGIGGLDFSPLIGESGGLGEGAFLGGRASGGFSGGFLFAEGTREGLWAELVGAPGGPTGGGGEEPLEGGQRMGDLAEEDEEPELENGRG
jgi:hypothetical protein